MIGREGIAGLVCLVGSLGLLAATWGLPGPSLLVPVGPGFYPRVILAISGVLSVVLIVADFLAHRRRLQPARPAAVAPANYALVLAAFAIFGVYVGALPWLGFRISTCVFVAALYAVLDPPQDWKRWLLAGVFAFIVTAVTYYLFEQHLLVLLPRGRWTDF
jgi:putative tricarboxylic transport membrane protein